MKSLVIQCVTCLAVVLLGVLLRPRLEKLIAQSKAAPSVSSPREPGVFDGLEARIFSSIDLRPYTNATLAENWHQGLPGNTLESCPQGTNLFNGVPFWVEGILQLSGGVLRSNTFPPYIAVKLGIPAEHIYFLHAAASMSYPGTRIGSYIIQFQSGAREEIPLDFGGNIADWWTFKGKPGPSKAMIGWRGSNKATTAFGKGASLSVYSMCWTNRRPGDAIESLVFTSDNEFSAPFLLGLTLATSNPLKRLAQKPLAP